MSASEDSRDRYRLQTWHRQSIDVLTEDSSIMESLLEQAVKDSQEQGKVSLLIKQRLWLADTQRMQGNYLQAISLYELLMNLTASSNFDHLLIDENIIWCAAKAFLGFVESKRLSSDMSEELLLLKLDEGLKWLEKIGKSDWAAGLLLQKGILLKAQDKLNDACQEMKDALERKRRSQEAPGYPLSTHQLEYAGILCNDAIREYSEAAAEAQKVLDTEGNSTYDRQWAYQTLAYAQMELARMGLGEPDAALEALRQAQTLAYTLENADALTAMTQLLGRLPRQVERIVEDISKQKTSGNILQTASTQSDDSPKHLICLVIFPVGPDQTFDYKNTLLPALREVLEQRPYYWEVADVNDKYYSDNTGSSMKFAQACIVDISDQNPDMFVELGRIHGARKDGSPLIIVLERESIKIRLSIESDIIHRSYPVVTDKHAVAELALALKKAFDNGVIERLNATKEHHYLSPLMFKGGTSDDVAIALSRKYKTMEAFTSAKSKDILQYLRGELGSNQNLNSDMIVGYKRSVSDVLKDL